MDAASPTADRIVGTEQTPRSTRNWTLAEKFFTTRAPVRPVTAATPLSTPESDDEAATTTAGVI